MLFQGDFSLPPGQPANDHVKALVPALEKLKLDFDRYIKVHASRRRRPRRTSGGPSGSTANPPAPMAVISAAVDSDFFPRLVTARRWT